MKTSCRFGSLYIWKLLILLLTWSQASGTSKVIIPEQRGFFRIDTSLTILVDTLAYYAHSDESDKAHGEGRFTAFNINNPPALRSLQWNTGHFVFKLFVTNYSSSTVSCAIRHYGKRAGTYVKVINTETGNVSLSEDIDRSFFGAAWISLDPGRNAVYIIYQDYVKSQPPVNIDFLPEFLLDDDRVQHFISFGNIVLPLLIFNFFLFYQILYILIQWYYHKKAEYMSYLMYLICLLIYFGFRMIDATKMQPLNDFLMDYFYPVNTIMLVLPYFFYLRFARRFLEMEKYHLSVNKIIVKVERIILALSAIIVFFAFFTDNMIAYSLAFGSVVILFVFTLWLIRFFFLQQNRLYKFFLIGSLFATTGHAVAMSLSVFGAAYWVYFPPILATMIGISIEIFYFNTGLGYKAKYEQEEKLKAQAELIGQLDENRKIQLRLSEMRNRIASDLHDDVGSTLSSIGLYSEVAMKQIEKDPAAAKSILQKISESSSRMMEAMSDIVWAIHSRQDEAGGLATRMTRFAAERLSLAGIRFEMNVSPEAEVLNFTIEARRNLLMLFKEAVNNAAKYSKATEITTWMDLQGPVFRLVVRDNGLGFDLHAAGKGHGLFTLKERASQLGGSCKISSLPGAGTSVEIEVPLVSVTIPGSPNHQY